MIAKHALVPGPVLVLSAATAAQGADALPPHERLDAADDGGLEPEVRWSGAIVGFEFRL